MIERRCLADNLLRPNQERGTQRLITRGQGVVDPGRSWGVWSIFHLSSPNADSAEQSRGGETESWQLGRARNPWVASGGRISAPHPKWCIEVVVYLPTQQGRRYVKRFCPRRAANREGLEPKAFASMAVMFLTRTWPEGGLEIASYFTRYSV